MVAGVVVTTSLGECSQSLNCWVVTLIVFVLWWITLLILFEKNKQNNKLTLKYHRLKEKMRNWGGSASK